MGAGPDMTWCSGATYFADKHSGCREVVKGHLGSVHARDSIQSCGQQRIFSFFSTFASLSFQPVRSLVMICPYKGTLWIQSKQNVAPGVLTPLLAGFLRRLRQFRNPTAQRIFLGMGRGVRMRGFDFASKASSSVSGDGSHRNMSWPCLS